VAEFVAAIRENYRHMLIGLAQAAASQIDPVLHDSLRHPEQRNGADYLRAVEPLRRMRRAVSDVHTFTRWSGRCTGALRARCGRSQRENQYRPQ